MGSRIHELIAHAIVYAPHCVRPRRWFVVAWTGILRPANKSTLKQLMKEGGQFGLLPGGLEEATISKHGVDRVYLKSRKGFIKVTVAQHAHEHVIVTRCIVVTKYLHCSHAVDERACAFNAHLCFR